MANGKGSKRRPALEEGLYEKNYIDLDWDNYKSGTLIATEETQRPDEQPQHNHKDDQHEAQEEDRAARAQDRGV